MGSPQVISSTVQLIKCKNIGGGGGGGGMSQMKRSILIATKQKQKNNKIDFFPPLLKLRRLVPLSTVYFQPFIPTYNKLLLASCSQHCVLAYSPSHLKHS